MRNPLLPAPVWAAPCVVCEKVDRRNTFRVGRGLVSPAGAAATDGGAANSGESRRTTRALTLNRAVAYSASPHARSRSRFQPWCRGMANRVIQHTESAVTLRHNNLGTPASLPGAARPSDIVATHQRDLAERPCSRRSGGRP